MSYINNFKKKSDVICWSTDFSNFRGEGVLARLFAINYSKQKKNKIFIRSYKSFCYLENGKIIFEKKTDIQKLNFFHKYLLPFYGIVYLKFHSKKEVCYLNYLPLWNFLIFLLLPKKTIFGPITGGSLVNDKNFIFSFIRKKLFKFFYKLSIYLIIKKKKKVIFSTDLLLNYGKKIKDKKFLFAINIFEKRKLAKKTIDYLIYFRNHPNKDNKILMYFLKKLILRKKKSFYCR